MIAIEKGIPVPDRRGAFKYPFGEMQIGDSFIASAAANSLSGYGNKRHAPKRFASRKLSTGEYRIWRIE